MLFELLTELKNFFDIHRAFGNFTITSGKLNLDYISYNCMKGQYIRIVGSVFNDGVYKYTDDLELKDETFTGAIWLLAIPQAVINLADEIAEWQTKYGGVDSEAMSPYTSESFGGYSYSKNGAGSGDGKSGTWQSAFASRMNVWRKIRV